MKRNVLCATQQCTDSHLSQGPVQDQQPKNVKDHKHLSSEYQERLRASGLLKPEISRWKAQTELRKYLFSQETLPSARNQP